MGLDRVDRQEQLLGDLLVGGRAGERGRRPCTDGRAPPARGAGWSTGRRRSGSRLATAVPAWTSAVGERKVTWWRRSAACRRRPAGAGRQALAVDERAVARQAVVDDRPVLLDPLELRVEARDLVVPVEHQVRRVPAPDRGLRRVRARSANSCWRRRRRGRAGTDDRCARPRCAPSGRRRGRTCDRARIIPRASAVGALPCGDLLGRERDRRALVRGRRAEQDHRVAEAEDVAVAQRAAAR